MTGDISDADSVRRAVHAAADKLGGLDVLVNNAGIGSQGRVQDHTDEDWRQVLDVNVVGTARVSREAWPFLTASPHAAVVNVSSIAATAGLPDRVVYSASKGAISAMTRAMAADGMPDGVRVNAVNPGTADTPWVGRLLAAADDPAAERAALEARQPHGRLVSAEEVADAVAYLVSPAAASTTGVDRGRRRHGRAEASAPVLKVPADSTGPSRVDAHLHVWDLARRPQPWTADLPVLQRSFSLSDVRPDQADAEVNRVVLVQCVDDVEETRELLAISAADERVAGVVGWLDCDASRFADDLAGLRAGSGGGALVGLRHQLQVETDKGWLDRATVRDKYSAARRRRPGVRLRRVPGAARTGRRRLGGPRGRVSCSTTAATAPEHTPRDGDRGSGAHTLAASRRTQQLVREAVRPGHPRRLGRRPAGRPRPARRPRCWPASARAGSMFGSDWPVCLLGAGYGHVGERSPEEVIGALTDAERGRGLVRHGGGLVRLGTG